MKKMLLFLLAGSLLLLAGCEGPAGPAGADGLLETNVVTGSFKVPADLYSIGPQANIWMVTLDDNLNSDDGIIATSQGFLIPGQTEVDFSIINVPAGEYYLFAHTEGSDVDYSWDGIVDQIGPDKESDSVNMLAGSIEACAFYGVFTDAQVELLHGGMTDKIHPAAPNVAIPETGWVDLEPFTLLLIPGV